MASENNSADFKITEDEMERFKTAMKSKEFRDLFMDYAKEISDPENKKKYEEDIIAMEKQRGQDVKLITPEPGYVIKAKRTTDRTKVFINVCTSDILQEYTTETTTQNGKTGLHVMLPHCFSPKRQDLDKEGKTCDVYDVCFHPKSLEQGKMNPKFRNLLIDTIFDGLKEKFNELLDKKHLKFPKLKFKGTPQATIIRKSTSEENTNRKEEKTEKKSAESHKGASDIVKEEISIPPLVQSSNTSNVGIPVPEGNSKIIPQYKMVHRGYFDMQSFTKQSNENGYGKPKELIVSIELPKINKATELDVDIFENKIVLDSKFYKLDLPLKCSVNEDDAKAKFDVGTKVLTISLPIIHGEEEIIEQKLVTEVNSCSNNLNTNTDESLHVVTSNTEKDHDGIVILRNDSRESSNDNGSQTPSNNQENREAETSLVDDITENDLSVPSSPGHSIINNKPNINSLDQTSSKELSQLVDPPMSQCECIEDTKKINNVDKIEDDNVISNSPSDNENRTLNYDIEKSSEGTSVLNANINLRNNVIDSSQLSSIKDFSQTDPTKTDNGTEDEDFEKNNTPVIEHKVLSLSDVHIPPYSISQDESTICIDILVKNVRVMDISVGFSHNEMNISFPQTESDDVFASEWSLFIRFLDTDSICAEQCGFDVSDTQVKVRLEKQESKLWKAVYVGATEKRLEFFGLEENAEPLKELSSEKKTFAPSLLSMEGRLQQLLYEQENSASYNELHENDESTDDESCLDASENDSTNEIGAKLDLLDLQDDVIDELSPLASPNEKKSRFQVRPLLERSLSHDFVQHPRLKSILKRSRSYSGNWDGDEYMRIRSATMSADDCYYTSTDDDTNTRRSRNKSVSFSDTPTVFEFHKLSKRQWKKQMRKQKYETSSNNSDSTEVSSSNSEQIQTKSSKKKKKAEKKRNRNNSESRSEEESELNERASKKQRKKKKKKQANNNILHNSNQAKETDPMKTPVLNNPLMFQLD